MAPLLQLSRIAKSFGPIKALRDVSFELRAGEIHALAGENGAGKSTTMKIVDGILQPDRGEIRIDGKPTRIRSPLEAQALGVGFVHQEIALCPDVSVAENIFMSATAARRGGMMNYGALEKKARKVLSELCDVDPRQTVGELSISNQQLVEIAKALTLDARILILDEPTSALTEAETAKLFRIVHRLKAQGMGIIHISHRMAEIFDHCDRVTVFRDGEYVTCLDVADSSPEQVVNNMVGREMSHMYPAKATRAPGKPLLEVEGLSDGELLDDISLTLREGEILGIGGLIGAGRSELAKAVCGLHPTRSGTIRLDGQDTRIPDFATALEHGVVYVSEDRKGEGLFLDLPISQNVSSLRLGQVSTRMGLVDRAAETEQAERLGRRLRLKAGRPEDPPSTLSGGNQQKVALARMLSVNPRVVFLDEPTRGVDVGAKSEIHAILRELSEAGVGVVVISSELPELIGLSDRILVLHEGRISGEIANQQDMTEEAIIHLASGLGVARAPQLEGEPA
ncbi:MAG: sugar ABC transporter ATP-binding protein [Rhodobacteraceae bacterium]|jgi:ribose transport system ATP-binding protein|uniref:Monosaccharide ABC transporter ATP-binding protein, CUT2 family n=1 Tax=Salipiger profundus TaxID=1229727 RepID=A0A1U7D669_9RHOB|nr:MULTISPECIES: sugar ABC transporter ATP-binding protein [Salipiger]APX23677.1 monosaccharide ABC transporter ATP-binding protein, CUT2 family [Salipiger profundus]MAB08425.1 sugar ABC transporter ATP-binding protein [Paracoccaceae bacterium]GGA17155.1 ribose import ATP-binding protein RbsA 2 [Salipiger profundus]SFD32145.1 monosaccharide ABC transporter ATP-binding protein, CUT2 family [Salipiger profundus]